VAVAVAEIVGGEKGQAVFFGDVRYFLLITVINSSGSSGGGERKAGSAFSLASGGRFSCSGASTVDLAQFNLVRLGFCQQPGFCRHAD